MKWGLAIALSFLFVPMFASAQVVINEVMYNPQGSDTGREWVELYNEGQSDVTMTGGSGKGSWRLSDGSNHTLTDPAGGTGRGSLTIPAGGYLIIANDPSDFSTGEYAGGTYSVVKSSLSLNNNGATVALIDGTGTTVDSVSYTPSQGGNDDGSSLQRQADGSWIAALPTPGSANSTTPYVAPVVNDSSGQQQSSSQTAASTTDQTTGQPETPATVDSYVAPPAPSVYADAGSDRTVIVGADVEFDASAYDNTQTLLDPSTIRFLWNFGDGTTAEGDAALHHFSYPGKYAVELEIADNRDAAGAQIIVTAQPAALSFSLLLDGGTEITNLAGRDLDLSGWVIRENAGSFASQFMLPQHSKILDGSSMQISPQTLSFRASSSTMLEYPNGALALAIGENTATSTPSDPQPEIAAPVAVDAPTDATPIAPQPVVSSDPANSSDNDADLAISDATDTDPLGIASSATSAILQTADAASAPVSKYLWWFGVAALAFAGMAALIAASHFKAYEWDIIEDKAD